MRKRASIIVAILLLAVGFAAISTTLVINGSTSVGENTEDFDVIFTKASLDGTDVYNTVIDSTKKIINFTTSDLKTLNQTSVLTYEVTNNSSNYDAEVEVNCKVKDNATAKYTSIENVLEGNATVIKAKNTVNGTLTVTLNKTATEEVTEEYTCTITANAVERDTLGNIINSIKEFEYKGKEETYVIDKSGYYQIETWGASGGCSLNNGNTSCDDIGYGAYSTGILKLNKEDTLYINIGGAGANGEIGKNSLGGYNGGGLGTWDNQDDESAGGGGGATHIALSSGLLSSFEQKLDDLLIVSGGGGGKSYILPAGSGGGYTGGITSKTKQVFSNQYDGYAFGKGEDASGSANSDGVGGGGGGFYGGYMNNVNNFSSATGGSGYIGNEKLLSSTLIKKAMYCYNCEEATGGAIRTINTNDVSSEAISKKAKIGNGFARIKYLGANISIIKDNSYQGLKINIPYVGEEKKEIIPISGTYKIEVWGAQGSTIISSNKIGGYGAYATGILTLDKNDELFFNVGGSTSNYLGGYNGGGNANYSSKYTTSAGGGGGATHIAFESGLLNTFENNLNNLIIVAGGGGGFSENKAIGGHAGGIIGNNGNSGSGNNSYLGHGGTQTVGGYTNKNQAGFGLGSAANALYNTSNTRYYAGGGGSGFYGGSGGDWSTTSSNAGSGGGGSSYIGNEILTSKIMYCYNCTESNDQSTKTISTTCVSETPTTNCSKSGNGYARITLIN